ncbi:altronate hydrolase [Paraburkholderia sp. BL23I1N1]|uniref:UxaA family hydrolase n=1 Tax=Paraburkholderia sp. BL23I1N1 TaxID=1938802 RepID=UPI000E723BEE|nr:altronate dehydratase family protein [Paraburkholderia sp. BL23I1N1]RKE36521.1 altronate hydrolase [Paraburkholderia sp. BL23I1N1]
MNTESDSFILLREQDNVAVARHAVPAGVEVNLGAATLRTRASIPSGHKVAVRPIEKGAAILKYGRVIGIAMHDIEAGEHVHTQNVEMSAVGNEPTSGTAYEATEVNGSPATFQGYVRANGDVGTRNFIGVIASVNCSATVCRHIAEAFKDNALKAFPSVDGVVAITHGSGCGMAGSGEGIELLRRTLRGYANNPNFAGVVLVGLGCEVNQIAPLVDMLAAREEGLIATLTIQEEGGTRETIQRGIEIVGDMLTLADRANRSTVSAAHLKVGLQCGGSDGYSGISANPALGCAVDLLVRNGGTAILSETPEIYGAEHLLTSRAASPRVADKLLEKLRWWEAYTRTHHGDMNNNPSPGNQAGGITTILEKSLGAVAKGGSTGLMEVYGYAEAVGQHGLVFMDTPGYDPVSATGQVAGGANLICFTTGRGSVYGCKPTPSLKLATNTRMFEQMSADMDFNCGAIVDGTLGIAQAGAQIFELMLDTASGRKTCSEQHGMGDSEFVPWQLGSVM